MTMTKKLINWATVPKGVKVTHEPTGMIGELLECLDTMSCVFYSGIIEADYPSINKLRLGHVSQQPWLVYIESVTVIPEWAECSFKGFSTGIGEHTENYAAAIGYVAHYKLGNGRGLFKDGWTDNPDEVKK